MSLHSRVEECMKVYESKESSSSSVEIKELPIQPPYALSGYQEEGLQWMRHWEKVSMKPHEHGQVTYGMRGGIIALEQGLGKTLQVLAHEASERLLVLPRPPHDHDGKSTRVIQRRLGGCSPSLVVGPKSILPTWPKNATKFFPALRLLVFHRDSCSRFYSFRPSEFENYDIVVTTYDVVRSAARAIFSSSKQTRLMPRIGAAALHHMYWRRIYLDESHKIVNEHAQLYPAVHALSSRWRYCLSGTPWLNYDRDLLHQLIFCGLGSDSFASSCTDDNVTDPRLWNEQRFIKLGLSHWIFRHTYETAKVVLPPHTESVLSIPFDSVSLRMYHRTLQHSRETLKQVDRGRTSFASVLADLTRLRQLCIAPFLTHSSARSQIQSRFPPLRSRSHHRKKLMPDSGTQEERKKKKSRQWELGLEESAETWLRDMDGVAGTRSPKMEAALWLVTQTEIIPKSDKIVMFCSFDKALWLFKWALLECGFREWIHVTHVIQGDSAHDRERKWEQFRVDGRQRVLLMTYKIGSEGVDLIEANHTVLWDGWWCPAVEDQAIRRTRRRGQTKPTFVWRILVQDSIDQHVHAVGLHKQERAQLFLHPSRSTPRLLLLDSPEEEEKVSSIDIKKKNKNVRTRKKQDITSASVLHKQWISELYDACGRGPFPIGTHESRE